MAENQYEQFRNLSPSSPAAASGGAEENQYKDPLPPGYDPLTRQPFQYVGNAPPGDPVAQSTGRPIREDMVPGAGIQAITSFPTDPEQKRRVVASQLFPAMDPKEAQARVFYGPNGRLAAVGFNGQAFYVDPDFRPGDPATYGPSAGALVGPGLPALFGAGGGLVAAPTSVVAGPVAAATGAAVGDFLRQQLANRYDPEGKNQPYNYGQTALEAGGAGVGQLAGNVVMRQINPNPLGVSRFDANTMRRNPLLMQQAEQRQAQAQAQGVTLTPGQASGLPSLLQSEDAAASGAVRGRPDLADIAQTYYTGQRNQLLTAADQAMTRVSSAADKTDATLQFQQGAEDATRIVRQQANAQARPAYQAAEGGGNIMSPDLAQLMDAPAVKKAMADARVEYANLTGKAAPETPDFRLWDLTKRKLDDAHTAAQREGERTSAMAIDSLRERLVSNLDTAYPTYEQARNLAAPGQRLASRLEQSAVGRAAAGEGTEQTRNVLAPLYEGQNARAVAEQRAAFIQAGKEGEWNAGTRAYLQDAIDRASKSADGLNPQTLRQQLWGNPNIRANLQAGMDPAAFQGLENFMGTIERVAQSRGMNSLTAGRQAGAENLEQAATQGSLAAVTSRGQRWAENPLRIIGDAIGAMGQRSKDRALTGIVDRLFSPDGIKYLQSMSRVPPLSQRGLAATANFLGQVGAVQGVPAAANALLQGS